MAARQSRTMAVSHTAGIFADMTMDGPEIGTLVAVIDRAKNLPNRKTMGKQDPYCAMRLAKDAKKTDTDRRGGQTPKWDQELRFPVRDSPDYYQLKCSVFNDDKKTDLIGETWIDLREVVVPGGGQNDLWHQLNFKGKYAGDIRVELTYYDSRPKPEPSQEKKKQKEKRSVATKDGMNNSSVARQLGPREIQRRPLPPGPGGVSQHTSLTTTPSSSGGPPTSYNEPLQGIRHLQHNQIPMQHSQPNCILPQDNDVFSNHPPMDPSSEPYNQYGGYQEEIMEPRYHEQYQVQHENFRHEPFPQTTNSNDSFSFYQTQNYGDEHSHERQDWADEGHSQNQNHQSVDHYPSIPPRSSPPTASSLNSSPPIRGNRDSGSPIKHNVFRDSPLRFSTHQDEIQPTLPRLPGDPNEFEQTPPPPPAHRDSLPTLIGQGDDMHNIRPYQSRSSRSFGSIETRSPLQNIEYDSRSMSHPLTPDDSIPGIPQPIPNGQHISGSEPRGSHRMQQESLRGAVQTKIAPDTQHTDFQKDPFIVEHKMIGTPTPGRPPRSVEFNSPERNSTSQSYRQHSPQTFGNAALIQASERRKSGFENDFPATHQMGYDHTYATAEEINMPRQRPDGYRHNNSSQNFSPTPPRRAHTYDTGETFEDRLIYRSEPHVIRPRAVSPQPPQQHTVHRKSVSPHSRAQNEHKRLSGMPFGPDSYDVLNPSSSPAGDRSGHHESGPDKSPAEGPIIGNDGRVIDPSDHLPSDTWAPEPERKNRKPEHVITFRTREEVRLTRQQGSSPASNRPISLPTSPGPNSPSDLLDNPAPISTSGRNRLQKQRPARPLPEQPFGHPQSSPGALPPTHMNQMTGHGEQKTSAHSSPMINTLHRPALSEYQVPATNNYSPRGPAYQSQSLTTPTKSPQQRWSRPSEDEYTYGSENTLAAEMSTIDIGASRERRTAMKSSRGYGGY